MKLGLLFVYLSVLCEIKTMEYVDLHKYIGVWYEIAHTPNWFEIDCTNVQAVYKLRPDGNLDVLNKCMGKNGQPQEAKARGWIVDKTTNSKLKVSFVNIPGLRTLTAGNYWVVYVSEDYNYAVVSDAEGKYVWILSRHKRISDEKYNELLQKCVESGINPDKMLMIEHD